MGQTVQPDKHVIIRIEGMHCHKCQKAITKALHATSGVHEAEVDFASGQASVIYDPSRTNVRQLMDCVNEAGYRATGFSHAEK